MEAYDPSSTELEVDLCRLEEEFTRDAEECIVGLMQPDARQRMIEKLDAYAKRAHAIRAVCDRNIKPYGEAYVRVLDAQRRYNQGSEAEGRCRLTIQRLRRPLIDEGKFGDNEPDIHKFNRQSVLAMRMYFNMWTEWFIRSQYIQMRINSEKAFWQEMDSELQVTPADK